MFFDPSPSFCEWLKKYANRRFILDCGSGDGQLLRGLLAIKQPCLGIEPFWVGRSCYDPELPVIPTTVQRYRPLRTKNSYLIVMARPDHSGWTHWLLKHAHAKSEVLYIGKPDNLYLDVGDWPVAPLVTPACAEEQVWRVERRTPPADLGPVLEGVDCLGVIDQCILRL